MSEFTRAFGGMLDNACPQVTVEVGLVEGGGTGGGSGGGGLVGASVGIYSVGTSASTSMISGKK